ncbi:MAG: PH domain-containing protein [Bacteroidia bacterium]
MDTLLNLPVDPATLPDTEVQPYHSLSPAYRRVQHLSALIFGVLLLAGIVAGLSVAERWSQGWLVLLLLAGWALIVLLQHLAIAKGFQYKAYALRTHDLSYRSGWLWRKTTSIPFNRIQHCEVGQGLIERLFGLAHVKVYTAGGQSSDMSVPGLLPNDAQRIKDFILKQATDA